MSQHLILTAELADAVRGQVTPMRALDPVELVDGAYALPVEVLNSPSQAAWIADRLGVSVDDLPRRDVGDDEWAWLRDAEGLS